MSRRRMVANSAFASACALGDRIAQREHQPIGSGVHAEAHLIGERRATAGAVGGELTLVHLDQGLVPGLHPDEGGRSLRQSDDRPKPALADRLHYLKVTGWTI